MNSVPVDKYHATKLLNHGCTIMVTAYDEENKRTTGMTSQWTMPFGYDTICIRFSPVSHTCKCLLQTKKFVVNVPVFRILDQVLYMGGSHGNEVNKFAGSKLHLKQCNTEGFGDLVIEEALGHVELELVSVTETEDTMKLVIGKIVSCSADPTIFNKEGNWLYDSKTPEDLLTVHHYGSGKFCTSRPCN
ncbi:Flavin reductase like domain-containing protein [Entamoeba marina]